MKGNLDKTSDAAHDYLPHGYPWLLLFLDKLYLLCPGVITFINIICVLAGSYILAGIFDIRDKIIYLSLVLISFVCIKHYTLVVADEVFTLIFISAIYFWSKFFSGERLFIIQAVILSCLGVLVRSAGVAVIAGAVLYAIFLYRRQLFKRKIVLIAFITVCIVSIAIFIFNINFFERHIDYVKQLDIEDILTNPFSFFQRIGFHLQELGEIAINAPFSKVSGVFGNNVLYFFVATGLVIFVAVFYIIYKLKIYNKFYFWVFICYLLIILIWPFYDTRFMIPVIPFFIYFFLQYLHTYKLKYVTIITGAAYLIFGLSSLCYSDLLSVNKTFFVKHYGADTVLSENYRIHFNMEINKPHGTTVNDINKDNELYLLDKYDKKPFN